ncbi:MAG: CesT family type III secretion system chaperone [Pseudomonadota bacterium]
MLVPHQDGALASESFDRAILSLDEQVVSREEADGFVRSLGRHISFDDLQLDSNGVAQLSIDDNIGLALIHRPGLPGLIVSIPIPFLKLDDGQHLKALLQANMAWPLTRGGVFGIPVGSDQVTLCWMLPIVDHDPEQADQVLGEMVRAARTWIERAKSAVSASTHAATVDSALPSDAIRV